MLRINSGRVLLRKAPWRVARLRAADVSVVISAISSTAALTPRRRYLGILSPGRRPMKQIGSKRPEGGLGL